MSGPSRMEQAIAALVPFRDLIDSGEPVAVEMHFYPAELKVTVKRFETVKLARKD